MRFDELVQAERLRRIRRNTKSNISSFENKFEFNKSFQHQNQRLLFTEAITASNFDFDQWSEKILS
jgi:hypothetical protein